jgi:hypothetical protein
MPYGALRAVYSLGAGGFCQDDPDSSQLPVGDYRGCRLPFVCGRSYLAWDRLDSDAALGACAAPDFFWTWLAIGIVSMVYLAFLLPQVMAGLDSNVRPGQTEIPEGFKTTIMVGAGNIFLVFVCGLAGHLGAVLSG